MYDQFRIFGWLLWRDLRVIKADITNQVIDSLIVPIVFLVIAAYIMPFMGMPTTYGTFMLVSTTVFMAQTTAIYRGALFLINDLAADRAITQELILPVSTRLIFLKYALSYAMNVMILNLCAFPLGKLFLWDRFDLSLIRPVPALIMYVLIAILSGWYGLWIASWAGNARGLSRYWLRYGSQIVFFGGFQFSWQVLNKAMPVFSYINLLNPFVYTFEGMRAVTMAPQDSLPWGLCAVMMIFYSGVFAYVAHHNLVRRLDCLE